MKQSILYALPLIGAAVARPGVNVYNFEKREVPQEHAHRNVNLEINKLLEANNPDGIQDAVFGLLGAKAAAEGAGKIADADCLQQAAADQAFTNAKAAGDVNGMTFALIYRALERNSGSVGLASPPCTSIQAVNPEIAALQQHQDPAGDGAQDLNKQIASELAFQIASIGGDPAQANEAGTFAPGQVGDPTAKGNTCDDQNDDKGCINTLNLKVDDLSQDEILAAAQGQGAGAISAGNATAAGASAGDAAQGAAQASGAKANGNGDANANDNANADANANAANASCANGADANAADANAASQAQGAQAQGAQAEGAQAQGAQGAASGGASAAASGAADFGSCADPTIKFGIPSDGRNEDAFEATDLTNFPHGSALNIGVISGFICDQLTNKCKANQAAVDTCDQAEAASKNLKGQAAADAFNSGLGL